MGEGDTEVPITTQRLESYGTTWAEREENILLGIDNRVKSVLRLKSVIDSISPDVGHDQVTNTLNQAFSETKASFPQAAIAQFEELKFSQNTHNALQAQRENPGQASNTESDQIITTQIDDLDKKIAQLRANPDVSFLENVDRTITSLTDKNRQIQQMKNDPDLLKAKFSDRLILDGNIKQDSAVDWSKVDEVRFGAFDVIFVCKPGYFNQLFKTRSVGGIHFGNSAFIALHRGAIDYDTIRHEKIHNLTDALLDDLPFTYHNELKEAFRKANRVANEGRDEDRAALVALLKVNPGWIIDELKPELIAATQKTEGTEFGRDYIDPVWYWEEDRNANIEKVTTRKYAEAFSTAGGYVNQLVKTLERYGVKNRDQEVSNLSRHFLSDFSHEFIKLMLEMENTLTVARQLGPDAHLAAHTLFYSLSPSKYYQVRRYLEFAYGKDKVGQLYVSQAVKSFDHHLAESVENLILYMEDYPGSLKEDERHRISQNLEDYYHKAGAAPSYDDYDIVKPKTLDSLRRYRRSLNYLGQVFGKGDSMSQIGSHMAGLFYEDQFYSDDNSTLKDIVYLYSKLNVNEKQEFFGIFTEFLGQVILDYYQSKYKRDIDWDDLPSLPVWKPIKKMGLDGEILKYIETLPYEDEGSESNPPENSQT